MIAVQYPGSARPYPGEMPVEEGVSLEAPRPLHVAEPPEPRVCQATTKAGNPCKGIPGDDGLCAAHKGADVAVTTVEPDPPQAEESGENPEDSAQAGEPQNPEAVTETGAAQDPQDPVT